MGQTPIFMPMQPTAGKYTERKTISGDISSIVSAVKKLSSRKQSDQYISLSDDEKLLAHEDSEKRTMLSAGEVQAERRLAHIKAESLVASMALR